MIYDDWGNGAQWKPLPDMFTRVGKMGEALLDNPVCFENCKEGSVYVYFWDDAVDCRSCLEYKMYGSKGAGFGFITQASEVSDGGWDKEREAFLYLQLLDYLLLFLQTQDSGLMRVLC